MNQFDEMMNQHLDKLVKFVPVVARVHGEEHPEFHQVKAVFDKMNSKLAGSDLNLTDDFKQLREITSNYEVPNDVCETYEAVYVMLSQLDEAFSK